MRALHPLLLVAALIGGCAPPDGLIDDPDEEAWLAGDPEAADKLDALSGVRVAATSLSIDLATRKATARIELERNGDLALEAGGLAISRVTDARGVRTFRKTGGKLRVAQARGPVVVEYAFSEHDHADGLLPGGSTVMWPYYCGNVYPCHSQPDDGLRFSLSVTGVPDGEQAIFPSAIEADAPPYMLAWATGRYTTATLGTTGAGTEVSVSWLPHGEEPARRGTENLLAIFDWYEQHVGAYAFGKHVGAVSVIWGEGLYGGMEHHPLWHVARDAMDDEVTHAHEAAHGWFGDAIRLRCWEDFVLSEGTVSYLAARAIGQVRGAAAEKDVWDEYARELEGAIAEGGAPAWPRGCGSMDIVRDKLFTNLPYMQGAYFYKDVAAAVGADVLDGVIARFYAAHRGKAAGMQDMIDAIERETGFATAQLVKDRLRKKF